MTAKPNSNGSESTPVLAPDRMLRTTWGAMVAVLGAVAVTAGGWAILRADVNSLQKKTDRHEDQLAGVREMLIEVRADVKALRKENKE
jgi:hypothetical protein